MATLPQSEIDQQTIDKANDYQKVVADAAWKRLLDNCARFNDLVLTEMRRCPLTEREKFNELSLMWKHYENYLTMVQNEVAGTLRARDDYIRNMLRDRVPEDKIEDLIRRNYGGS